jgi:hypothetical protein
MCYLNLTCIQKSFLASVTILKYSGISIYQPRNVRFPVFTMHHHWFRIKSHINNVIYFRIHRSPKLSFFPTQHFPHGFFRMVRLRKKLKRAIYVGSVLHTSAKCGRLYVCMYTVYPYLFVLHYLRFLGDLQF